MEKQQGFVALPSTEVPMVEPDVVRQIRELHRRGFGLKAIKRELGIGINTVRRYVRGGDAAETQVRPAARQLDDAARAEAVQLLDGPAAGNAVVVARLLRDRGVEASVRTVQRAVEEHRRERRAADVATVRFETAPGHQMQVDFGEKLVSVAGALVKVFFFVAVLSYSRRIFVRAFLSERQDDWREGFVSAFRHFGGLPQALLIDNAGALVDSRDRRANTARLHPAFAAFCRDWELGVRVCQPYRARTKGKTESGVGYVKRNAIAGLEFESFASLEAHLTRWIVEADDRVHGTTHERPHERFERDERAALRPLPAHPLPVRERRLDRRVANDCFVDVDTVRYSVPHRLVRRVVQVLVGEDTVRVFDRGVEVACHRRTLEPHTRVVEPSHYDGLWRRAEPPPVEPTLAPLGRTLADYAAALEGGAS